ncbi:MAG: hypothetical protein CMJ12_01780 [Pelagibacterales bacterium]|nr:hypothetical protein [Pelagibacterales bacterium]PPR15672.1 MAG: hypothetical protein CFH33_01296 [Alphaproteobacteria bacterium MarineAlpha9_Bin3]|tara:strand:- start:8812 stop:9207 length:396 start_codon:yes stop_codon:yes gene_type:complete
MDLKRIFKNLILLNIGMFILIIISSIFQSTEIIDLKNTLESGFFDTQFGVILVVLILLIYLIAIYCLYNFKPLGRSLFLLTILGYIICLYFGKIQIIGQITYILQYIATLTDGAILTLIYFSPLKEVFTKK